MNYLPIYLSSTGGLVDLHPLHGADELPNNTEAARVLADHGHAIELLPSIPAAEIEARIEWLWDVTGQKNPDVRIDGYMIGDIKTPDPVIPVKQKTINRCIYACGQQKVTIAIINLWDRDYSVQDIKKGVVGALQPDRNKSIEEVWVITKAANLFKVDRCMVFDDTIYELLHEL
jgi:hypothetical protein